jgi:hypothetical protein
MALVSGPTLGGAIADPENAIRKLVDSISDDAALVDELFVRILNRHANAEEIQAVIANMTAIQRDHEKLSAQLTEREAWWIEEKPKRQASLDQERENTRMALEARREQIRPEREAAERARLERLANAQAAITAFEANLDKKLQEFIDQRQGGPSWQTLAALKAESTTGAMLAPQSDRSIRASGAAAKGIYTIDTRPAPGPITAVRLEALSAPDLPAQGPGLPPNGNFVITELELFAGKSEDPAKMRKVKLVKGITDFDQGGFSAAAAIDGRNNDQGGWAVAGRGVAWHQPLVRWCGGGRSLHIALAADYLRGGARHPSRPRRGLRLWQLFRRHHELRHGGRVAALEDLAISRSRMPWAGRLGRSSLTSLSLDW